MTDAEQGQVMHPCVNCGNTWSSKLAAAECCDPAWDDAIDRGRE